MPLDHRLRLAVDSFVTDISELVRRAALEAVREAVAPSHSRGPRPPRSRPRRGGSNKRSPEELAKLTQSLRRHIEQNPGQRIEVIARALGTSTRALNVPAKKLIKAGAIKTKGVKRATRYLPK